MDENTTTEQAAAQTGVEPTQPVTEQVAEQPADVTTTTELSEPSQDAPAATDTADSAPVVDDKLQKYAKSQGLELDSPSAIKAAQIAMKNQSEATRNYQQSKELEKSSQITQEQLPADASSQDVENARLRNIELQLAAANWKTSNPDKAQAEAAMAQVLVNDPQKAQLVQQGLLSFDDLHAIAVAGQAASTADSVKSQVQRETLETLAQNQQAAVPRGSATNPSITPSEKPFEELSIAEMEKKLGFVRQ